MTLAAIMDETSDYNLLRNMLRSAGIEVVSMSLGEDMASQRYKKHFCREYPGVRWSVITTRNHDEGQDVHYFFDDEGTLLGYHVKGMKP